MRRGLSVFLVLTVFSPAEASAGSYLERARKAPRVASALTRRGDAVRQAFREAGAAWPPRIFLSAFKLEGELELWAAPAKGTRWVRVRSFPICAKSGTLGPKREEGDGQVPEGFYRIDRANPRSSYHLSLGLDYPNRVDRARNRATPLGGDIFVHGACVTIGCLPLTDGPMEDLYLAHAFAKDGGQASVAVHLFPCRPGEARCQAALAPHRADPALGPLWKVLEEAHQRFVRDGAPPRVVDEPSGVYRILPLTET